MTEFLEACKRGPLREVEAALPQPRRLLDEGLTAAALANRLPIVARLAREGASLERAQVVLAACCYGHRSLLAWALKRGAHPDRPLIEPPLFWALQAPSPLPLLRVLVGAGVSLKRRNPSTGDTPLHAAVVAGAAAVKLFTAAGAAPDPRDARQRTPLHRAAELGDAAVVRALLAAGADTRARDRKGRRPVDVAVGKDSRALLAVEREPARRGRRQRRR